ncbi:hypothetical protein Rhal01_01935 [Rubritalea halochordaticola]|uniref:Uncharacterized protein n=1 Tax=Rubritalea halochordaticola TaxID=714537 RepID=A0ABP9V3U7_9BACT
MYQRNKRKTEVDAQQKKSRISLNLFQGRQFFRLAETDHSAMGDQSKNLVKRGDSDLSCRSKKLGYILSNEGKQEQGRNERFSGHDPSAVARALRESHEASGEGEDFSSELQIQEFIKWIGNCGEPEIIGYWESLTEISNNTAEHLVRYDVNAHRAIKKTLAGNYGFILNGNDEHEGSSLLEYLDRLALQNELFGDDIRVIGGFPLESSLALFSKPTAPVLTSQPFRDGASDQREIPTEDEIECYMSSKGFVPLKDKFYGWWNEEKRILVVDAKPDNFVFTREGIVPIDLQIKKM